MIDAATRALVRQRAGDRGESCRPKGKHAGTSHHLEHITARQHGGSDDPANLALACQRCNSHNGPKLTGIDPESGQIVPLFHPRQDLWTDHLEFNGPRLFGRTATGRVTILVLAMNDASRVALRVSLLSTGEPF